MDDDLPSMTFTLSMEPVLAVDILSTMITGRKRSYYGDDDGVARTNTHTSTTSSSTRTSTTMMIMKAFEIHVTGTVSRMLNNRNDQEEEEEVSDDDIIEESGEKDCPEHDHGFHEKKRKNNKNKKGKKERSYSEHEQDCHMEDEEEKKIEH
jgi:hypothetical protein